MMLAHLRLDVQTTPVRCRHCKRTFTPTVVQDFCSTRCTVEYLKLAKKGHKHVAK